MLRIRHAIDIAALALSSLATAAAVQATSPTRPPPGPEPAIWSPHELIVELHALPHRYSCDELWYKFHDVLLALGARPDMKILTYQCESALGAVADSPRVELEFSVPSPLSGPAARWATLRAVMQPVTIAPGRPSHIDARDCDLLDQMKDTLLPAIGDRVGTFELACQARSKSRPPFSLALQALLPVSPASPAGTAVAATGADAGSGF